VWHGLNLLSLELTPVIIHFTEIIVTCISMLKKTNYVIKWHTFYVKVSVNITFSVKKDKFVLLIIIQIMSFCHISFIFIDHLKYFNTFAIFNWVCANFQCCCCPHTFVTWGFGIHWLIVPCFARWAWLYARAGKRPWLTRIYEMTETILMSYWSLQIGMYSLQLNFLVTSNS
jgi:hypothetical protein